jgi:hypothetical protein
LAAFHGNDPVGLVTSTHSFYHFYDQEENFVVELATDFSILTDPFAMTFGCLDMTSSEISIGVVVGAIDYETYFGIYDE